MFKLFLRDSIVREATFILKGLDVFNLSLPPDATL
jgi:hypothetical protein